MELEIIETLREINAILTARSRELDRRADFDKRISSQIREILKQNKDEKNCRRE